MTLTTSDLIVVEGEPRVTCQRMTEALGFNRVNDLHRLIRANDEELRDFGGIFCFEAKKSGRGRPQLVFQLNEKQAIAITMWANTPQARAVRRLIVEVFYAWRQGHTPATVPSIDPFAANAARAGHIAQHLSALECNPEVVRRLTHLPIWANGRRPIWWHNLELRAFLTATHRQMTLAEARAEGQRRFGGSVPSVSGIQRYWSQLDRVFGPDAGLASAAVRNLPSTPVHPSVAARR